MNYNIIKQLSRKNIINCNARICLCVEYLDFKEKSNFEKYKQCFITHEKNSKYEKKKTISYNELLQIYECNKDKTYK